MASMWDAVNDSADEKYFLFKHILYALPVFFCAWFFINKNMGLFYLFAIPTFFIFVGLFSCGITNIRQNKREILILNPVQLLFTVFSLVISVLPTAVVMFFIGYCITTFVSIPSDIPYFPIVFKSIVWAVVGSVVLTAFLSFSKYSSIKSAYNFSVIFESCADVLINILFLIPQLIILNGILVGTVWYLFYYFKLPLTNPVFIFYCSCIFVFNVSVLADYFAQVSYELIRGDDDEYRDNYYIRGNGTYFNNKKK